MSAAAGEGIARANGSRSRPKSADASPAGEQHEGGGAVVVVGLPVKPIENYEFCEQVIACHDENQASRTNVIEVLNVVEIQGDTDPGGGQVPAKPKRKKKSALTGEVK